MTKKDSFYQIKSLDNLLEITIWKSIPNNENWKQFLGLLKNIHTRLTQKQIDYSILFNIQKISITDVKYYKDLAGIFIDNDKHLSSIYFICRNKVFIKSVQLFSKLFSHQIPIKFIQNRNQIAQKIMD